MRLLAICLALAACGPAPVAGGLGATLGATPSTVSQAQPTSVLKLVAWDQHGDPGEGPVHFVSFGGALLEGPDVELTEGAASITFRCLPGADQGCQGAVRIDGQWRGVTAETFVQVTPP